MSLFFRNAVQYITDNILLMMLASSISLVSLSLYDKDDFHALSIHAFALLQSIIVVIFFRALCLRALRCGGPIMRLITVHALLQLPWFVRVPAGSFSAALTNAISTWVASAERDPCRQIEGDRCGRATGEIFLVVAVVFLVFFFLATRLSLLKTVRSAAENGNDAPRSAVTFLCDCALLACLGGAGNSLHDCVRLATGALRGTHDEPGSIDSRHLWARAVEQAFLTLLACWQLGYALPAMRHGASRHVAAKADRELAVIGATETAVVYAWSYGASDNLWYATVTFRGGHRGAVASFWAVVLLQLLCALALAASSHDRSFYAPNGCHGAQTTAFLLFWLLDFCVWRGWSQLVLDVDQSAWMWSSNHTSWVPGEALHQSGAILGTSLILTFGLFLVVSAMYACNAEATRRASTTTYRTIHRVSSGGASGVANSNTRSALQTETTIEPLPQAPDARMAAGPINSDTSAQPLCTSTNSNR